MADHIGIVIPSYNESKNIPLLARDIFTRYPDATVMVIDDSNKEENRKIVAAVSKIKLKHAIFVISREKKSGRGSAVLRGFQELLKNKKINYFFEMDADLAHDPADMQKFLGAIRKQDTGVVIGSRYIENSHIKDWPLRRLISSKVINAFINLWLDLQLSDYTNGFRLYSRKAVEYLNRIELQEKGFIALSEIAYRLQSNGFKIGEVPITFTDRRYGKSSADIHEFISSLVGIVRIRLLPVRVKS